MDTEKSGRRPQMTFSPACELARGRARLRTQRELIRSVMLSAAECGTWLSLSELGGLTHFGEASISAQLRHLRKPQFGSYRVEKRRREEGGAWEYRLLPPEGHAWGETPAPPGLLASDNVREPHREGSLGHTVAKRRKSEGIRPH